MARAQQSIETKLRRGISTGIFENYIPWISKKTGLKSRKHEIQGIKINRQHLLLSDLELDYFMLLEFSDNVIDIREQYPLLPIEQTKLIANQCRIPHPRNKGEDVVMTTDFVILKKDGTTVVRTIKYEDELEKRNVMEHFEIERRFFDMKGWEWGIETEKTINRIMAKNILKCRKYYNLNQYFPFNSMESGEMNDYIAAFFRKLFNTSNSIYQIAREFDEMHGLPKGTGISIFEYLIIKKIITVNLNEPLDFNNSIKIINAKDVYSDE